MDGADVVTAKGVPCVFRAYEVRRDGARSYLGARIGAYFRQQAAGVSPVTRLDSRLKNVGSAWPAAKPTSSTEPSPVSRRSRAPSMRMAWT